MSPREVQQRLAALRKMGQRLRPNAEWALRNRETLMTRVRIDLRQSEPVHASWLRGLHQLYASFVPHQFIANVRGPVTALLSGIAVILTGSIASVSAAERALPGDLLYPVKIAAEQTRLVFAANTSAKIRLKTEFVVRRVEEIKQLNQTDLVKKPQLLKEATDSLKRDLDTVKKQLADTQSQGPVDRTKSAKLVDDTGTHIAASLKEIRVSASTTAEARTQIVEAESAAINTSMKAVQVILETQSDSESQKIVSREQLIQSINAKVEGVETHLSDAAQQLANSVSSTLPVLPSTVTTATGTLSLILRDGTSTSSIAEILTAHTSLNEAKQLLIENKIEEVTDKLVEANKAMVTADKKIEQITASQVPSTNTTPPVTPPATTTTTVALPVSATTSTASAPPTSPASSTERKVR